MAPSDMWLRLLPIAIISAIAPLKISAMILLFRTPRGGLTGAAYVAGVAAALLVQGLAMVLIFAAFGILAALELETAETVSFGLLVVLGVLMLVGALRLRYHDHDDDRPPPSWMEGIESFTPRRALSLGFGWAFISPKQWIFTLAAITIIYAAGLERIGALANYVVFIAIATSTLWLLVLAHSLFGERIKPALDRLLSWLESNTRRLIMWLLLIFGAFFLTVGIAGLAG